MYDIELKEEEWKFYNSKTTNNFDEFDKWLEELVKKNGTTKY
tara:strand:+ start:1526 stop:1651 length:126 start_codon:yes stop_codon:yes gene_type:complete